MTDFEDEPEPMDFDLDHQPDPSFRAQREAIQLKSSLNAKNREVLSLKDELEARERHVLEGESKLRDRSKRINELEERILELEEQVVKSGGGAPADENWVALTRRLREVERELAEKTAEAQRLRAFDPEAWAREKADLTERLAAAQAEVQRLLNELAAVGTAKTALQLECDRLRERSRQQTVDVCLVVATDVELKQLTHAFGLAEDEGYLRSTVGGKRVAAVQATDMGMAAAACAVSALLLKFRPRLLAMCGIAGGFSDAVAIGNLVVANPAWDYTRGKYKDGKFQREPNQVPLNPVLKNLCASEGLKEAVQGLRRQWPGGTPPKAASDLKVGPMASGGAVIDDTEWLRQIREQHRKVIALDMEAYAVMLAGRMVLEREVPTLVVKGISDLADGTKDDTDQQAYCAWASAQVVRMVIEKLPDSFWS